MSSDFYKSHYDKSYLDKPVDLEAEETITTIEELGDIDVEELAQLDEAALKALLYKYEPGDKDSPDHLKKAKKQITQAASSYQEVRQALAHSLKKETNTQKIAKGKALIKELDGLLKNLKHTLTELKEVATDKVKHTIDGSDGKSFTISEASLKLDGGTYTYTLGGSAGDGLSTEAINPLKDVTSDGTINGTVKKDVNNDHLLNKADIDEALSKAKTDLKQKQNVMIKTGHWTLASADTENDTYTFKVEGKDGNYCFVTFNNASDSIFAFNSGITNADLEHIKDSWPTDLLKQSYGKDYSLSLYERAVNGGKKETDKINPLTVIDGYSEAHNISAFDAYTDGPLSGDLKVKAEAAIDKLFGAYAEGGKVSEKAQSLWGDIISKDWAGVSDADKRNLIEHVVAAIAVSNKDLMGMLVGPVIPQLEGILAPSGSEPSTKAKAIVLILETQCMDEKGPLPGTWGGASGLWTKLFAQEAKDSTPDKPKYETGDWKNHADNQAAIEAYKTLVAKMGGLLTSHEKDALDIEAEAQKATDPKVNPLDHSPKYKSAKAEYQALYATAKANANEYDSTNYTDESEWLLYYSTLEGLLFKGDGSFVDDPASAIISAANADGTDLEDSDFDNLLGDIVRFLDKHASQEMKNYLFPKIAWKITTELQNNGDIKGNYQDSVIATLAAYNK